MTDWLLDLVHAAAEVLPQAFAIATVFAACWVAGDIYDRRRARHQFRRQLDRAHVDREIRHLLNLEEPPPSPASAPSPTSATITNCAVCGTIFEIDETFDDLEPTPRYCPKHRH